MLLDPPPLTNCHTFLDLLPSSVTYFMGGPNTGILSRVSYLLPNTIGLKSGLYSDSTRRYGVPAPFFKTRIFLMYIINK